MTVTKPTATAERAPAKGLLAWLLGLFRPGGGASKTAAAGGEEEPPLKVHVTWSGGVSVDVVEQFRRKKMQHNLKVLQRLYKADLARRQRDERD